MFKLHTQTPLPKSGAIYLLEVALALNGIATVEDGTNFAQVVPISRVASLKLQAPQRDPSDPLLDPKTVPDFLSNRSGAANELVAYYAELTRRTTLSTDKVANVPIIFRVQTPLTKAELLYALDTILALNGLAIIEVDEKTIRAGYINELKKTEKKS
jgi:hypothetical protein